MIDTQTSFVTVGGKAVFYCLSDADPPSKSIVIMSHGFRGTHAGPARSFVDFARILNAHGYAVLRFDQINSGNSEGDFIDSSFRQWVDTTAYLAERYLSAGYRVALLGQSMGATASAAAAYRPAIRGRIDGLLLWVPDPKSTFSGSAETVSEEGGQLYRERFWLEARDENFFAAMEAYNGPIHLVYGENDRYVSPELRQRVIETVRRKGQEVLILPGQDHSPWDPTLCQQVYGAELAMLDRALGGPPW